MRHARFKTILGISVSALAAVYLLAAVQPAVDPQGQWKVILPKTNIGDKVRMAALLNETFGLWGGAGDVGKAHYTMDGGKTWTVSDSSGG